MTNENLAPLPEVTCSEDGSVRHLHLDSIWVQGSMQIGAPTALVHEYIQRMMAWLLLHEPDTVVNLHAMQLGLGAGSLTKFCHQKLRLHTTVVEINPQVVAACRTWFKLPEEDLRLQIILADAAQEVAQARWRGRIDALQVDLYDSDAAAPVLDSPEFYAACRSVLSEQGSMTVNLFGHRSSFERSVEHLATAFGRAAIWAFRPTREGNTVLLALRDPAAADKAAWVRRAPAIQQRWGLPAAKWVRALRPVAA